MAELTSSIIDAVGGDPTARSFSNGGLGSVVRTVLSKLREVASPEDFGCVGDYYLADGSVNPNPTNDLVNYQKALDSLKIGQILRHTSNYWLGGGSATLATKFVTLEGPGGLVNGTLVVGNTTAVTNIDYNIKIRNMIFNGGDNIGPAAGTLEGISFRRARMVIISNCLFRNLDKSISCPAGPWQGFHATGMIRVDEISRHENVKYGFYTDYADGQGDWDSVNDCSFNNQVLNLCYVSGIRCKGIDGFQYSGMSLFQYAGADAALRAIKSKGVYIGRSDWVHGHSNNLFESGEEGIHLNQPKRFELTGNLIARNGQKTPSSAILIDGANSSMNGVIHGNVGQQFTKHLIEISTNLDSSVFSTIAVGGNNGDFQVGTTTYYGTTPLASIEHYGIFQPANSPTTVEETSGNPVSGVESNLIQNAPWTGRNFGYAAGTGGYYAKVTVPASTPTAFATLARRAAAETNTYDALLYVNVRSGSATGNNVNTASYLLHISKALGARYEVVTISSTGLKNPVSPTANWPGFTWTVDGANNKLIGTPVTTTAGDFFVNITMIGSARLFRP